MLRLGDTQCRRKSESACSKMCAYRHCMSRPFLPDISGAECRLVSIQLIRTSAAIFNSSPVTFLHHRGSTMVMDPRLKLAPIHDYENPYANHNHGVPLPIEPLPMITRSTSKFHPPLIQLDSSTMRCAQNLYLVRSSPFLL